MSNSNMLSPWKGLIYFHLVFSACLSDLALAGIASSRSKEIYLRQPNCVATPEQYDAVIIDSISWGPSSLRNPFYVEEGPARVALLSNWCGQDWFLAPPESLVGITAFGFATRASPVGTLVKGLGFRCGKRGRLKHNPNLIPHHIGQAAWRISNMISFCHSTCRCVQDIRLEEEDKNQPADKPRTNHRTNNVNHPSTNPESKSIKSLLKGVSRQFLRKSKYTRMKPMYCPSTTGEGRLYCMTA